MSEETHKIQWLGNQAYLVYQNLNESDACIVFQLTDAQQLAVEEFESRQWTEKRNFAEKLMLECNQ